MSNLEKYLGVPNLFIKRDDLNGLGLAEIRCASWSTWCRTRWTRAAPPLLTYGGP